MDGSASGSQYRCPMDYLEFAKRHPRTARAVMATVRKVNEVIPETARDPHGWPRMASCADVDGDPRKVRAVAREVYIDLVGLEDSNHRIDGERWEKPETSVERRFPGGGKDLEMFVTEVCHDAAPDAKPFWVLRHRFARELGLAPPEPPAAPH
jgi:hypothetical protein